MKEPRLIPEMTSEQIERFWVKVGRRGDKEILETQLGEISFVSQHISATRPCHSGKRSQMTFT